MLKEALEDVAGKYKYIIIDSPPSLGLLTINVLTSAHTIVIPIQCEYYALEGLSQLLNTIRMVQKHLNKELEIEGILVTMYDHRLNLSRQVVQELKEYFGDKVYTTYINRNVRLGEAPSHGKPILLHSSLHILRMMAPAMLKVPFLSIRLFLIEISQDKNLMQTKWKNSLPPLKLQEYYNP